MEQNRFLQILKSAVVNGASDIHLTTGLPPGIRIRGEMTSLETAALTDQDLYLIFGWILNDPAQKENIKQVQDLDGSFEVKNLCRFRFNAHQNRNGLGIILRIVPGTVPSIDQLGLPKVLKTIATSGRGLVLVTGATGSGKSSTLAAMIDYLNASDALHILTIEDPIEYIHTPKRGRITQREIGTHTRHFASALRSALRQDPDVILVGEMRDAETIDIALKAAETGHLVFSTIHTTDAIKTIGRLLAVFPSNEQHQVRIRLADNLVATISQRLVKRRDQKGMLAAQEIMLNNTAIQECISKPELTGQMNDFIAKSYDNEGGQTFEQHLGALFKAGLISIEEARAHATNAADLERNLKFGQNAQDSASDDEGSLIDMNDDIVLEKRAK